MNETSEKWLLPVDGSVAALRAVDHLIAEARQRQDCPQILLLNVQSALPADITRFVSGSAVQDYHREAGEAALAEARRRLDQAGLACSTHILIGDTAPGIANFAREQACTRIVIGARGLGAVAGLLLGSVTHRVMQLTDLPVLLVK